MSKYFIGVPAKSINTNYNPKDNHLTIAYLGSRNEKELKDIVKDIKSTNEKDFVLDSKGYKKFNGKIPHLSFKDNVRLQHIYESVKKYNKSEKGFKPHVSIGGPINEKLPKYTHQELPVNKIVLYRIDKNNKGNTRYSEVKSIKLKHRNIANKIIDWFRNKKYD